MRLHRYEVHAAIEAGQTESLIDRSELQLVTLVLTDGGPVIDEEGREHRRPDVVCHLRPSEAGALAGCLLSLAERADGLSPSAGP